MQRHHPATGQCRSAAADHRAAQVGAWPSNLVHSSKDVHEAVLDELLGLGGAADQGVGEANHPGVLVPIHRGEPPSPVNADLGAVAPGCHLINHHPYGERQRKNVAPATEVSPC